MVRIAQKKISVGVSGATPHSRSVRAMIKRFGNEGAKVIFLSSNVRNLATTTRRDIARIDAFILMGNDLDIDPKSYIKRYKADDPKRCVHPQTRSELSTPKSKIRARYEEAMLKRALASGMPVLGICGGMHRINVLCGGTLHQHIPDLVGCDKHRQHKQGIALHIPVIPVVIKDNTKLAEVAGNITMPFAKECDATGPKVIMENSMHHQAVDIVASGFRVCAVTDTVRLRDGTAGYLPEAIESDPEGIFGKQFILGVQWHPEFGASPLGVRIVHHFIKATRSYVRSRSNLMENIAFKTIHSIQVGKHN